MTAAAARTETKRTPGPYGLSATDTEVLVQGRHGKIIRRYPKSQHALALADVRRLIKGHTAADRRVRNAAPELLGALRLARSFIVAYADGGDAHDRVLTEIDAAIAKAAVPAAKGDPAR